MTVFFLALMPAILALPMPLQNVALTLGALS